MKREEEIKQAYLDWVSDIECSEYTVWKDAVEWADEHPHWISIEDQLPELYENHGCKQNWSIDVLFKYGDGEYAVGFYHYGTGEWYIVTEGDDVEVKHSEVTHWMPIPQFPKDL